jgi:hypothetical protein
MRVAVPAGICLSFRSIDANPDGIWNSIERRDLICPCEIRPRRPIGFLIETLRPVVREHEAKTSLVFGADRTSLLLSSLVESESTPV